MKKCKLVRITASIEALNRIGIFDHAKDLKGKSVIVEQYMYLNIWDIIIGCNSAIPLCVTSNYFVEE